MDDAVEDFNLPVAPVTRIIKESLPQHNIASEAKLSVARAAFVFILYLATSASSLASRKGRKTINAQDILQVLMDINFGNFIAPLEESFLEYQNAQAEKKLLNAKQKQIRDQDKDGGGIIEEHNEEQNISGEMMEAENDDEFEDVNN